MAPNIASLNKWYRSESEEAAKFLEDYCYQFSKEYYLDFNKKASVIDFNNSIYIHSNYDNSKQCYKNLHANDILMMCKLKNDQGR